MGRGGVPRGCAGCSGSRSGTGRRQTLLLARDRAGIKPLHYAERGGRLYFGSRDQVAPRRGRGRSRHSISRRWIITWRSSYTPRDRSMFKGVRKLPPGHLLRWRDGRAEITAYWQYRRHGTVRGTDRGRRVEALRTVLADAVRSHMISDVPLGAFLSGGIDSCRGGRPHGGSVRRPVQTFSIGFDDPAFDELKHARTVARHFGTDHHEFVVRPDGLSILDRLDRALRRAVCRLVGDPHVVRLGDRAAARHGRAVGRRRRRTVRRLRELPAAPASRAVRSAAASRARGGLPARSGRCSPTARRGKNVPAARGARRQRPLPGFDLVLPDGRKARRSTPRTSGVRSAAGTPRHRSMRALRADSRVCRHDSRMMRFDFETYLPEDVLTKVDRMSMAHSIESRVPLLDNRVIDFAARASCVVQDPQRPPQARAQGSCAQRCSRPRSSIGGSRGSAFRSVPGSGAD